MPNMVRCTRACAQSHVTATHKSMRRHAVVRQRMLCAVSVSIRTFSKEPVFIHENVKLFGRSELDHHLSDM
eukprot:9755763-Alexandrium_andersonii.AAC.1